MFSSLLTYRADKPADCFAQLVWVLGGLVHALGYRRQHCWVVLRIAAALTARIERVRRRLTALIAAVRAGTPLPVRVARPGRARDAQKDAVRRAAWREVWFGIRFRPGWLCDLVPMDAAALGGFLGLALGDPALRAVMAQDARIGRLLRPLLRMLGGDMRLLDPDPQVAIAAGRLPPQMHLPWRSDASPEGAIVPVKDFLKEV